jgi:hypothetical protein
VLTLEVPVDPETENPDEQVVLYERMRHRIAALPGVATVGLASDMPLRNPGVQFEVKAEGRAVAPNEPMPRADYRTASPEYFRAAGCRSWRAGSSRGPTGRAAPSW